MNYLKTSILTPKRFIKYHRKLTNNGEFPTILVTPATKCKATLAQLGYIGLKTDCRRMISVNQDQALLSITGKRKFGGNKLDKKRSKN